MQYCALIQTDETSRLRDRAFVYFSNPIFKYYPYPPQKPTSWAIDIQMINVGNMPARNVSVQCEFIKSKLPIDDPFQTAKLSEKKLTNVIGPKQAISFTAGEGPLNELDEILQGKLCIQISAQIEYIDGFDLKKKRVTQISRQLHIDNSGGYSFSFSGRHNCAEDDCEPIK